MKALEALKAELAKVSKVAEDGALQHSIAQAAFDEHMRPYQAAFAARRKLEAAIKILEAT